MPADFPTKKYSVIYADPPWSYDNGSIPKGGVDKHYSTMTLDEIKALPVSGIANDPSVLFLWATFPLLPEALQVMAAWGFTYKTLGFSWLKTNSNGSPMFGVGYYAKSNCEVCLMGVRGSLHSLVKNNSVSSVVISRVKEHSEKPSEVRSRIERLFGNVPRIELFARNRVESWDCWGNEIPDTVQKRWTFADEGWV